MLSDSESDVSLHDLTINEHYAKAFEYKKEREELEKLKEKYGSDGEGDRESETDSEDLQSEDEDGEELTPAVDAAILRTLARIKRKDPEIYNSTKDIFGEEQEKNVSMKVSARAPKDKSRPITMRQVALESALNANSRSPSPQPVPHIEEQRTLRHETIVAFHHAVEDDAEDDGLFVPREKSKDEREREEEEYRSFLEREVGQDLAELVTIDGDAPLRGEHPESMESESKKRKKKDVNTMNTSKTKHEANQEFLMDYIVNRGWIDRSANRVPTYAEITSTSKGKGKVTQEASAADSDHSAMLADEDELDEDDFEEIVDRFESSYNFRFEEPDAAVIKSYPRILPSTVRREDTTRKEARERRKQRKEDELLKKKEDVKRLKALKMKEISAKLEKIGREGGMNPDNDRALQELDLDGDWDPDAHDRQMAGLYGDEETLDEEEKPKWDDDIDIGDIPISGDEEPKRVAKKKKKKKTKEVDGVGQGEGVDVDAMDADVERIEDDEEWDGSEEMRKKKLDEYMGEIYGLDFNDMVGDMPTRFKYVPVQPQNFALTPVEILMATDAELNEYMSVKKYAPYRKESRWDSTRGDRLKELRQKVSERRGVGMDGDGDGPGSGDRQKKKRKGKKERMKLKVGAPEDEGEEDGVKSVGTSEKGDDVEAGRDALNLKRKRGSVQENEGTGKRKRRRHKKKDALT